MVETGQTVPVHVAWIVKRILAVALMINKSLLEAPDGTRGKITGLFHGKRDPEKQKYLMPRFKAAE